MSANGILAAIDWLGPMTTDELCRELRAPRAVVRNGLAVLVFVDRKLTAQRTGKVVRWLRGNPKALIEVT